MALLKSFLNWYNAFSSFTRAFLNLLILFCKLILLIVIDVLCFSLLLPHYVILVRLPALYSLCHHNLRAPRLRARWLTPSRCAQCSHCFSSSSFSMCPNFYTRCLWSHARGWRSFTSQRSGSPQRWCTLAAISVDSVEVECQSVFWAFDLLSELLHAVHHLLYRDARTLTRRSSICPRPQPDDKLLCNLHNTLEARVHAHECFAYLIAEVWGAHHTRAEFIAVRCSACFRGIHVANETFRMNASNQASSRRCTAEVRHWARTGQQCPLEWGYILRHLRVQHRANVIRSMKRMSRLRWLGYDEVNQMQFLSWWWCILRGAPLLSLSLRWERKIRQKRREQTALGTHRGSRHYSIC